MIATGKSMTHASGQTTGAVTLDVTETTDQLARSRLHSVVLAHTLSRWVVVLTRTHTITVVLVRMVYRL